MTMIENFRNFLMINGHYDSFCTNVMNQRHLSFDAATKCRSLREVIDASMTWHDCPEGSEYWSIINIQWQEAYDEGKVFTNRCKSIW